MYRMGVPLPLSNCILYIESTNILTEIFETSPFFLHKRLCNVSFLVHKIFTFSIKCVQKLNVQICCVKFKGVNMWK